MWDYVCVKCVFMWSYNKVMSHLSRGEYASVYFLEGEESFFIDSIIAYIELHALDSSEKIYNQQVFYGKEAALFDVIGAARKYPMLGDRQVVIVKEAQELKGWNRSDAQALLIHYLESPMPCTILVFGYKHKSIDKRTKLGKVLEKGSVFVHTKKLYDSEIPSWIEHYCRHVKVKIDREAVMMLTENIGNNLQRLANEVGKLMLNLKGEGAVSLSTISRDMVEAYTGIHKEYNIFELQKAVGTRQRMKVMRIIYYFSENPSSHPLVLTIYGLFSYFSKLLLLHHTPHRNERMLASLLGVNPYFVREYVVAVRHYPLPKVIENIGYINRADLESKGIGSPGKKDKSILMELTYKLMN